MFGFHNRLLSIDMSKKSSEIGPIPDELLRATLRGKGLATHLLLQHNPPKVDPLSPENHMILSNGPVAGTAIWGSCRHGILTKSPQTHYYSESYSGGTVAEYIAITGYDAVIIRGASEAPIWIEVCEDGAFFHSARDIWGMDTFKTEDQTKMWIKENRPEARNCGVICIGPAGENQVRFALVENDYWRSAGRTGVGAVMGSRRSKPSLSGGIEKKNWQTLIL